MNKIELNNKLLNACREGNLGKVKKLVKDGADIHYRHIFYTTIEIASTYGHLEIVKRLYEHGADPTTHNNYAIKIASGNGHLSVVKYLHSIGCNPIAGNNFAIQLASKYGHLEVVKYLYSIGCDPTDNNNTAIHMASWNGNIKVVKYLALIGCDISKICHLEMRKEVIEYLNKYKPIMDKCLSEIYGNPRLERTRTENEISFREYLK